MRFAYAHIMYWMWSLILLTGFFWWASRRAARKLQVFVQKDLADDIASSHDKKISFRKKILLMCVVGLSLFSLARPQWGFEWQEVKRQGLDILVAIDTSKSMLTQDVKPNRLARTKLAVKDLIKKLDGDRIGLIAFAGESFLACPLTLDYSGFMMSLDDLDAGTIPRGGTNLSQAIQKGMEGYKDIPSQYKALVILTDGENLEGDPMGWAKKAKAQGIKIYCVGIGTREGELIQIQDDFGNNEFLKDEQDNFVKSRLNESLLQDIALVTGGLYVRASGAQFGLDIIYEKELAKFEKREIESRMEKQFYERFQIPLALALLLLVVETCLSSRKKKKGAA